MHIEVTKVYKHYKGKLLKIVCKGLDTETRRNDRNR